MYSQSNREQNFETKKLLPPSPELPPKPHLDSVRISNHPSQPKEQWVSLGLRLETVVNSDID